jgi:hypothetical protein
LVTVPGANHSSASNCIKGQSIRPVQKALSQYHEKGISS